MDRSKQFEKPEMEVIEVENSDVITTSGDSSDDHKESTEILEQVNKEK